MGVLNLGFAKGLEAHFQAGDQCTWYWLNIVLDCTLGVGVEYVILMMLMRCIRSSYPGKSDDFETGDYKSSDGRVVPAKYIKQVGMWLAVVTLMKLCMSFIMVVGHSSLTSVATAILKP